MLVDWLQGPFIFWNITIININIIDSYTLESVIKNDKNYILEIFNQKFVREKQIIFNSVK